MEEKWKSFFIGFELGGWRLANGSVMHIDGYILDDWPNEIEMFGRKYRLKDVKRGKTKDDRTWESAFYG